VPAGRGGVEFLNIFIEKEIPSKINLSNLGSVCGEFLP
jgi:hypothetical protein